MRNSTCLDARVENGLRSRRFTDTTKRASPRLADFSAARIDNEIRAPASLLRSQAPSFDDDFSTWREPANLVGNDSLFRDSRLFQAAFENRQFFLAVPTTFDFLRTIANSTHVQSSSKRNEISDLCNTHRIARQRRVEPAMTSARRRRRDMIDQIAPTKCHRFTCNRTLTIRRGEHLTAFQCHRYSCTIPGWVAEWFKAPVLKTGVGESPPWVRIPPHPLSFQSVKQVLRAFCEECDLRGKSARLTSQLLARTTSLATTLAVSNERPSQWRPVNLVRGEIQQP
jgi:hypothetical protein